MDKTILCLSWLNGRFSAMAVDRGTVTGSWSSPDRAEDFRSFPALLDEAVAKTGYKGSSVALVLAHPRLIHQLVETPPIRGWTLDRFLDRQVSQMKAFDTEAVWAYQPAAGTKTARAVLLHAFPKPLLDQLMGACEAAGLKLVHVLPPTAVLLGLMKQLQLPEGETAMIAADTVGSTLALIGRKDGEIFIARSLGGTWAENAERLVLDINRTILFVKQKFGQDVQTIWLLGEDAPEHLGTMQQMLRIPVRLSPVAAGPLFWVEQALKLAPRDQTNLISTERRQAPQRRRMVRAMAVVIGLVMAACIATAGWFEYQVQTAFRQIEVLEPRAANLTAQRAQWLQRYKELAQQKELVRLVTTEKLAPVPGWFLAYLGEVLPNDLVLTHLDVRRTNDAWSVQLAGSRQPSPKVDGETPPNTSFHQLTNDLRSGPFRMKIARSASGDELDAKVVDALPLPAWLGGGTERRNRFFVEGTMQ